MFLKSIHVLCGYYFLLYGIPFYEYAILLLRISGLFPVGGSYNSAALKIFVYLLVLLCMNSLGYIPGSGIAGS